MLNSIPTKITASVTVACVGQPKVFRGKMGCIKVYNSTKSPLTIRDHYVLTATPKSGYDGALRYSIAAGDIKKTPTDDFLEKAAKNRNPQEIHVNVGEETHLIWEHEEFISNEGKEVILKMGGDGVLHSSFVAPGGISALRTEKKTMPQWIRKIFSFPSAGANVESPVAELGLMSAGSPKAGIPVDVAE
ncbi:uncharacterized protein LOC105164953 [Sesamum indicum]|uniref:Uncharacterized protein LOC105164953 n=1 Tax=Sesamum indicum TaxID=4182 RepID=A0A6I9TBJ0_SESIN|nr:uncharacterized protein LOC105164953 [Sesamum indicum]